MPGPWPLVGRAEELRLLGGLGRGGGGIVVAGAAGVGKTRLAREAIAAATRRGVTARWVSATASARDMPLGAFASFIDPSSAATGAAGLVRAVCAAVEAGAAPAGTVLGVDDAHLLDTLSATAVYELAQHGSATLVVTLRTGEPAPDAITALWKDASLPRLELQPLSADETRELLEAALGAPVDSGTAGRLWTITRGNPLYLRHLVDGEREAGRLVVFSGVWRWIGEPVLGPGLAALVEERIGALSIPEREVVDVLAFGEPLELTTLQQLAEPSAVELAEERRIVETVPDTDHPGRLQARLAHPLYGEVRRSRCGQLRARRLRGRIARQLAADAHAPDEELLRRAVLSLDSDLPPDAGLLADAATRAAGLTDLTLAERLARAAIAAGGGFAPRLTLLTVRVGATTVTGTEFADVLAAARTDSERVRAVVPWVTYLAMTRADADEAGRVLSTAESTVTDQVAGLELRAQRVVLEAIHGDRERAIAVASTVLAAPAPDAPQPSAVAAAYTCYGLVVALALRGRVDELEPIVGRGVAAATRAADLAWLALPTRAWQVLALCGAGRLSDGARLAGEARELYAKEPLAAAFASLIVGHAELARGHVASARRWVRQARAGMSGPGDLGGWLRACLIDQVLALAQAGDPGCGAALAELEAAPPTAFRVFEPDAVLARAWVEAARGSVTAAVGAARQAAELAAGLRLPSAEVAALHTAVCFGDRTVAGRLAELASQVDGPRAPAAAAHAAALAADDATALLAVADLLEAQGACLLAADAAAQAAAAHTRTGRRGSAAVAAARAQRLAARCEGARTPALVAVARPLPLTKREREVATLVAGGLSNREIAGRLVVSVRTVEGHVYRACGKLGVTDRAGLAAVLNGDG